MSIKASAVVMRSPVWSAWLWRGLSALFILFFFLALTSWPPFSLILHNLGDISDDLAFLLSGSYLLKVGAQWGPDVVFTYGPLEFLAGAALYGGQAKVFLAFRATLAVTTAYLIVELVQSTRVRLEDRVGALLFFLLLGYLWFIGWFEAYWITVPFVVLVLHMRTAYERSVTLRVALLIASALMGAAALVKFSFTVIYVGLFALMALRDVSRRRIPWEAIVFTLSLVVSWMLAGQSLVNFPVWLSTSLNLSDGYSAAMSRGFGRSYSLAIVILLYASAILFVLSAFYARRRWIDTVVLGIAAAGFALVNIQHSFGGNQIEQSVIAMISSAAVVIMIGTRATRILGSTSIAFSIIILVSTNFSFRNFASGPVWLQGHVANAALALTGRYPDVDALREQFFASVRDLSKLPDGLKGTMDIYVRKTGVALAYPDIRYTPRPSFLSLNAHTEQLARDNATFVASARGPDYVVFDNKPDERTNNRYPATDDGPSWPVIWSKYQVIGQPEGLFLFEKRSIPIGFRFVNERRLSVRALDRVTVDSDGLVWAAIDIRPTWAGSLLSKLYKSPNVFIRIVTEDGSEKSFQIVPELGRAGFLMSPWIRNAEDFASQSGPKIRSFQVIVENRLEWLFRPDIAITLSELVYERRSPDAAPSAGTDMSADATKP